MSESAGTSARCADIDTGRVAVPDAGDFDDIDVESHLSDDASAMTTRTIATRSVEDLSVRSSDRPKAPHGGNTEEHTIENDGFCAQNFENFPPAEIVLQSAETQQPTQDECAQPTHDIPDTPPAIPRGRSIAHKAIVDKKAVFLSLDVETGGEFCGPSGLLQLSGELFRIEIELNGWKDAGKNLQRARTRTSPS